MMKNFLVIFVCGAVIAVMVGSTDLMRAGSTIDALNRYRNAKAYEVEVEASHKADIYALEATQTALNIEKQRAELRQQEQWSSEAIQMTWVGLFTLLTSGVLVLAAYVVAVLIRMASPALTPSSKLRRTMPQPQTQPTNIRTMWVPAIVGSKVTKRADSRMNRVFAANELYKPGATLSAN
jgi:hypothetical protein